MFTNEFLEKETVTTILDDSGKEEDVKISIDGDEVWISQWCETLGSFEYISMTRKMFMEMLEALELPEGAYNTI